MPDKPDNPLTFWQELKRRKVIRVIIVYVAVGFAIIEFVDIVSEPLNLPEWALTFVIVLVAIGFPIAVILSWAYEITPSGIEKTEPIVTSGELRNDKPFNSKAPLQEKSIIVLPFENISPDPEQEYFSDGLTEEIITDLSHIHDLLVISRSSAMTFKGKKNTIREIAEKVNVRYVLEGSVRKAGNNLRITAQLIDAENDAHIWAEKYSGTLTDVFDIQERVSQAIVTSLEIKLSSEKIGKLAERKVKDVIAYEHYLLARHEIWSCTKESLSHSIELLNNSLKRIGRNEYLLVALGTAYFQYVNLGIDPNIGNLNKADELVSEAIELNPSLAKAHYVKSMIHETRGDLKEAFNSIRQALELDPADSEALMMMAFMHGMIGKPHEAKPFAKYAIQVDPLNPLSYVGEWWVNMSEGQFDKALETCHKMYTLDKNNLMSLWTYAYALASNNQIKEATKIFDSLNVNYPDQFHTIIGNSFRHAINNNKQQALESVTEQLEKAAEMDHLWAWILANVYSLVGEKNQAIDYLERATKHIFINYPWFSKYDPFLENIRSEERFKKLMKRVKHQWESFEI